MTRNPTYAKTKNGNGNGNGKRNGNGFGIGDSPSRYRGFEQALGERPFVDDMSVPGMLHGGMVLSEHPRAKVNAIDLSEAQAMPGVVRIFTAADVPGERGTGLNYPDLPIFVAVGETTCCVGDFLAMVVADTAFHARQAADKVKVDYTVLEPVTDPFAAMEPGAPQVHPPGNLVGAWQYARYHRLFARRRGSGIRRVRAHHRADAGLRSRSNPHFSNPKLAWPCRKATELNFTRRARARHTTTRWLPTS